MGVVRWKQESVDGVEKRDQMKILFCCEFYAPSVGGVQEVIKQLAERMIARGHSVTVATTAIPSRGFKELHGVKIQEFAVSGNLVKGMRGDVDLYRRFVTTGAFDVVMIKAAQQWTFDALWPALDRISGGKVFIPCGFSCLYEPDYAGYFEMLPRVLNQFDHLIFYATEYRDIEFVRKHGLTNFSIIPNGASEAEFGVSHDRSFRQRFGLQDKEFLFLTVGSPASTKGHYEIAAAFLQADFSGHPATLILNAGSSLSGLGVKPVVSSLGPKARAYWRSVREVSESDGFPAAVAHIGRGVLNKVGVRTGSYARKDGGRQNTFEERLLALIGKIHDQRGKRVVLTDLPREDLLRAYANADLFVFASHVEYSPLVLFESAAAGTPFLSVPVGNASEIAEWTGAGVICPASQDDRGYTEVDPALFAAQWSQLANDRTYLERLGAAGKRNWADRFTWEKIADQYEGVFRKVLAHA